MKYCNYCGNELEGNRLYCGKCGARIQQSVESQTVNNQQNLNQTSMNQQMTNQQMMDQQFGGNQTNIPNQNGYQQMVNSIDDRKVVSVWNFINWYFLYLIIVLVFFAPLLMIGLEAVVKLVFGFLGEDIYNIIAAISIVALDVVVIILLNKWLINDLFRKKTVRADQLPKLKKWLLIDWWILAVLFLTGSVIVNVVLAIIGHRVINKQFLIINGNY